MLGRVIVMGVGYRDVGSVASRAGSPGPRANALVRVPCAVPKRSRLYGNCAERGGAIRTTRGGRGRALHSGESAGTVARKIRLFEPIRSGPHGGRNQATSIRG